MCSLRFENNFLTIEHVCIASKKNFLTIERVHFALISKKTPLSKLLFRFDIVAITIMGYSGAWVKLIHEKN